MISGRRSGRAPVWGPGYPYWLIIMRAWMPSEFVPAPSPRFSQCAYKEPPRTLGRFVFFAIAVTVKVQIALGVSPEFVGRYYLLYAGFLLTALLFWSVAFLHRQRAPKVVGAVGVIAGLAPIIALVIGHAALGSSAFFGVGAILSASEGGAPIDLSFVTLIERIFGLWCYLSAWLLWRGHIRSSTLPQ